MADVPSFPCAQCGYAIPATMPPGMKFPCPGCQAPITVPVGSGISVAESAAYRAQMLLHGNTASALADAAAPASDSRRANFASTSIQSLIRTPSGRDLVIGTQVAAEGRWAIRAQDLHSGNLVWETPYRFHFSSCPGVREVALRDGLLYVVAEGVLRAFDPDTGAMGWENVISASPESESFDVHGDEMQMVAGNGVAVLTTTDDRWLAFSTRDGRGLWRREVSAGGRVRVEPGVGFWLLLRDGAELVAPSGETLVAHRGTTFEGACLVGRFVVIKTDAGPDDEDDSGVLLINRQTGVIERFISAPGIEIEEAERNVQPFGDCIVASGGMSKVYRLDPKAPPPKNGPGIFGRLLGHTAKKNWAAVAGKDLIAVLRASQDALCVEVTPPDGGARSVRVLDPHTFAVRYDSGPLPHGAWEVPLIAAGPCLAFVVPSAANAQIHELICVHTTSGKVLWRKSVGYHRGLAWSGERVQVRFDTDIELLDPMSGDVLGSYPVAR